jgi:tetratricopeptide (TPR) repeat protein
MSKLARFWVKPWLHGETIAYLLFFLFLISPMLLFGQGKNKKSNRGKSALSGSAGSVKISSEGARALVLTGNLDKAVSYYSFLIGKDSANISLNGEYAYALALDGIYDAALARLDKAWNIRGKNTDIVFYASQVYALMGYDLLADELGQGSGNNSAPDWISSNVSKLIEKYKYRSSEPEAGQEDVVTRFKRANRLTAQDKALEAIALFEGIVNQYPDEYLPYVGYSIALERNAMYNKSAQAIEKAISLAGDSPENASERQLLDQRLVSIRSRISTGEKVTKSGTLEKLSNKLTGNSYKYTAYAGGTISKSFTSLSARFGTYKTGIGSTSVDVGITSASGSTSLNLGFLTYFRKKIFVAGWGITGAFANGSSTGYLRVSMGTSLMNKKRTASLDIFIDGQSPIITKGAITTMGLSIGRSVYFGKR